MIELNWTIFAAAAIFLLTLLALDRLLFRPLFRIQDERKSRTSDQREEAARKIEHYESLFDEYQKRIKQEKQSGYQKAESVRHGALQERQDRISQAREESHQVLTEAREQIQRQVESAQRKLERDAEEISRVITGRVLGRS